MPQAAEALIKIDKDKPRIMNILYIEDIPDVRDSTALRLEGKGYKVDAVSTPREAVDLLEPNKYQLAIVDIDISIGNSIQGDDFISKSRDFLSGTKVIAYTGFEGKIKDKNRKLFRKVIKKGEGNKLIKEVALIDKEFQKAQTTAKKQTTNVNSVKTKSKNIEDENKIREELITEFKKVIDKKAKLVFYDGKEYSAEDLIKEIEDKDSEVGRKHISLMVDLKRLQKEGK